MEAGSSRKMQTNQTMDSKHLELPQAGTGTPGKSRPEASTSGCPTDSGEGNYPLGSQSKGVGEGLLEKVASPFYGIKLSRNPPKERSSSMSDLQNQYAANKEREGEDKEEIVFIEESQLSKKRKFSTQYPLSGEVLQDSTRLSAALEALKKKWLN